MTGDDAKTDPHQVSHLVAQSTGAAVDHLHCLRKSMRGEDPHSLAVHIRVPFSLARGAIENASTALWLMSEPNRQERVRHRLRYEWTSIEAAEAFMKSAKMTDRQDLEFLHTLNPGISAYQMTAPVPLLWTAVKAAMTMTSLTYQK